MNQCYRCTILLNDQNESIEHIIPNACGGRLKSKNLLCKNCNSKFGKLVDVELAKNLNYLCVLLNIKRDRGEPKSIRGKVKSTGEDYYLSAKDSHRKVNPEVSKSKDSEMTYYNISTHDEDQFKQILKGLKKKYPQLDINEVIIRAKRKDVYLDEPIHSESAVGGKEVFKAISKIAVNFFILKGGKPKNIEHLIHYIDGQNDLENIWFYYPEERLYTPKEDEVSHLIHLRGNKIEKVLYCYIELFNSHNFIIKLSDDYNADDINQTYVYDLIGNVEVQKVINKEYSREHLIRLFTQKDHNPQKKIQETINRVLNIAMKRRASNHHKKLIKAATTNFLEVYPIGSPMSVELKNAYLDEIVKQLTPYLAHLLRSGHSLD